VKPSVSRGVQDSSRRCEALVSITFLKFPCTRASNMLISLHYVFCVRVHGYLSKFIEIKVTHKLEASWTPPHILSMHDRPGGVHHVP
jgi:hypothetical protein